jgi:TPR repeat protein
MKTLRRFLVLAAVTLAAGSACAASLKAPRDSGFAISEVRGENFQRTASRVIPAAQRGDARAQAQLGFMHAYGRGVPQNYGVSIYWYVRSAEQGNPVGQHLLGLAYDKGHGVLTDHIEAHKWLNLAAAASSGAEHEDNVRLRDAVANKLTKDQLVEAMYRARTWLPKRER